jgi:GSH-dependent disulfide-bond oxidoreductase
MIDLYLAPTANGQRAAVALAECGLEFKAHRVDLAKGEQRTPQFLKMNPAGQTPVLVDHDGPGGNPLTLAQSGAIILYASDKSGGRYLPKDPAQRALVLQWFMQGATDVSPTSGAIFQLEMVAPEKNEAITHHFKKRLLNFFAVVNARLGASEYLAGELSIADFMLYPNYFARKALLEAAGGLEHLHAWGKRMAARPGVAKGMNPFA